MFMNASEDSPLLLDIVIVEDHHILREELQVFLESPHWRVRGAEDADELDALLRQHRADVVVLDLNLPGEDGLSICQRLRTAFADIGIVMLTGRLLPKDRVTGYEFGADVYLTKPARPKELQAVIQNLQRRIQRPYRSGLPALQLEMCKQVLNRSPQCLDLTALECALLYALSVAPDRTLSHALLFQKIHPLCPRSSDQLRVNISRLRAKIKDHLLIDDVIRSVHGFGYQLCLPIAVHH
jgi:DNA-binding response OmpR family regulator